MADTDKAAAKGAKAVDETLAEFAYGQFMTPAVLKAAQEAKAQGRVFEVPFEQYSIKRGNIRDHADEGYKLHRAELTGLIRDAGRIRTPLKAYIKEDAKAKGKFRLVNLDGETRFESAGDLRKENPGAAQWLRLPVIIEEEPKDKAQEALAFLDNSASRPPTQLEEAVILMTLKNAGWKWDDAAARLHKSRPGLIQNVWPLRVCTDDLKDVIRIGEGNYGYVSASDVAKRIREETAKKGITLNDGDLAAQTEGAQKVIKDLSKSIKKLSDDRKASQTQTGRGARKAGTPSDETQWWTACYGAFPIAKERMALAIDALRNAYVKLDGEAADPARLVLQHAFTALNIPATAPEKPQKADPKADGKAATEGATEPTPEPETVPA